MSNKKIILIVVSVIVLIGLGILGGMEYKAYQVRSAIREVFNTDISSTSNSSSEKNDIQFVDKSMNEEIALATLKYKVNGAEEKQIIEDSFPAPLVATEGAKFIIVNTTYTNTIGSEFYLNEQDFNLIDDKDRFYSPYDKSISLKNGIMYKDLAPGIPKSGIWVFEIPSDSLHYSVVMAKAGTSEYYRVKLK